MGQKTNPIGNRLGIIRGWDSNWFSSTDYADNVIEDERIRRYIRARVPKGGISRIIIERTLKRITLTVHTSRPGIIIGKGGSEIDLIKEEVKSLFDTEVQINVVQVMKPELDAALVGQDIAKRIESRFNYRRAAKMAIQSTMRGGAEGIKVRIAGRLNGADMAREEEYKEGSIPLHTFRSDIDFKITEAQTVYGKIGVKVWICRGEVLGERDLSPHIGNQQGRRGKKGRKGRGGGRRQNRGRGKRR